MGKRVPDEACFYGTVRVGDRGQIVIPAEARQELGIKPGDKMMAVRDPSTDGILFARVQDLQELITHLSNLLERAMIDHQKEDGE